MCWRPSWLGCLLDLDKWVSGDNIMMGDGKRWQAGQEIDGSCGCRERSISYD